MSVSIWPFIEQGSDGVAYIEGTRTKVIEVALDQIAYDWDAAEIHRQYPYLSLPSDSRGARLLLREDRRRPVSRLAAKPPA